MPGFITHYICGEAVLRTLPEETRDIIKEHRQLYNVGTQGPDMFFYYLPGLLKKNMKNIGVDMHKMKFSQFMSGMLDGLGSAEEKLKPVLFAYIAGYLTHYTLDYNTHPYVYYKSGFKVEGDKTHRLRYSVYHRNFETAIDVLMLKMMSSQKPSDQKLWRLIKTDPKQAVVIADVMSASINSAYGRDISAKQVFKAMRYMVNLTRILQSKKGRRKRMMELAENLTIGEHLVSSIIHNQEINDGIDYLNVGKKPWYMPWDNEKEITASFGEMYNVAVEDGKRLILQTELFMKDGLSKDALLFIIGNRSLASGVDCDDPVEFLHHGSVFA